MKITLLKGNDEFAVSLERTISLKEALTTNVLLTSTWSHCLYKDFNQNISNSNWLSTAGTVVVDIDDGLLIQDALTRLQDLGLAHIVGTTKHHRIEKHGIKADRYRIILSIDSEITELAHYEQFYREVVLDLFPEADKTGITPSRKWRPFTSIVAKKGGSQLVVPPFTAKTTHTFKNVAVSGFRGELSKRTREFLTACSQPDAFKGQWNAELYVVAADFNQQLYSQEECIDIINNHKPYLGSLDSRDLTCIRSAFSKRSKYPPRVSYASVKQLIRQNPYYRDETDRYDGMIYHHENNELLAYKEHIIDQMMLNEVVYENGSPKLNDKGKPISWKVQPIWARFDYIPFKERFSKDNYGRVVLNLYNYPNWRKTPPPITPALPTACHDFFWHLVDGNQSSYVYLLDWMANSLRSKNRCYLVAIGNEGVGKGTLGNILRLLHGEQNFREVGTDTFRGRFNAELSNRTCIYGNELNVTNQDDYDRVKRMCDDTIRVERKGKEASEEPNYSSLFISANEFNAINVKQSDRRYSIINLNDTPLKETKHISLVRDGTLFSEDTIQQLGWFLLNREITCNMLEPYRGERAEEIIETSMTDWKRWLIYEWIPSKQGQSFTLQYIQDAVCDKFPEMRQPPKLTRFIEIAREYPKLLKFHKNGKKNVREICVLPTEEQ